MVDVYFSVNYDLYEFSTENSWRNFLNSYLL